LSPTAAGCPTPHLQNLDILVQLPCSDLTSTQAQVNRRESSSSQSLIDRDIYTDIKMAAAIKALNAKIRSNPYTDYLFSTRKRDHHQPWKRGKLGIHNVRGLLEESMLTQVML